MKNAEKIIQVLQAQISSGRFKSKNELAAFLKLEDSKKSKLYNALNRGTSVGYDVICEWFDTLGISLFEPLQDFAHSAKSKTNTSKARQEANLPLAPVYTMPTNEVPTIKRMGENAPVDYVDGMNLQQIPVYGLTGAGGEVELIENEPIAIISILPQYNFSNMSCLKVDGDSMAPTIPKGAYVGVIPHAGSIQEGGVYLVERPYLGRMIKRIKINSDGALALFSDNPKYDPIPLDEKMLDSEVIGKVMWTLCAP